MKIEAGIKSILFSFLVAFLTFGCKEQEIKKPNIVFILADDLGYGDLSSYGATKVSTPNIDRLANEGMKFTNAYSPHSVCTPTRYSLMCGRYAWRTWNGHTTVWSNDPLLIDTNRVTLPKILKAGGYKTAIIGKWHLGFGIPGTPNWDDLWGPDYTKELTPGPLEVGFDYFHGIPHVGQRPQVFIENHHVVGLSAEDSMHIVLDEKWLDRISYLERIGVPAHEFEDYESARYEHEDLAVYLTDKAVDYIHEQKEKPFFLYFAHRNVHAPLNPNPRFKGSQIGVYGDFINEIDWSVGEILNALDNEGLTDNTIVIFSSDNGGVHGYRDAEWIEYNGHKPNGPLFGQKTEVYEGGVHVPLLVRWPGIIKEASESGAIVALTDMLATMAEFTGYALEGNTGEDSFSFLHQLTGGKPKGPVRESVVVDATSGMFAIRKGPWKFIAGQHGGGVHWDEEAYIQMPPHKWNYSEQMDLPSGQLYNLEKDPGEQENLYEVYPEIVVELKALLREVQYGGRSR